eukprot:8743412-Alexandrium_andersonii.AAC.1
MRGRASGRASERVSGERALGSGSQWLALALQRTHMHWRTTHTHHHTHKQLICHAPVPLRSAASPTGASHCAPAQRSGTSGRPPDS